MRRSRFKFYRSEFINFKRKRNFCEIKISQKQGGLFICALDILAADGIYADDLAFEHVKWDLYHGARLKRGGLFIAALRIAAEIRRGFYDLKLHHLRNLDADRFAVVKHYIYHHAI